MKEQLLNFTASNRKTFIEFIELLRADFLANPDSWENKTLDDFLEAMSRCIEDIQGYYDYTKQGINADEASWQIFADVFKISTIYE